jgi:uncharacterized repeat protein (TIGR02543 family)
LKISKGLFLYTILALSIISGLLQPQTALASPTIRRVPQDYSTIQAAINAASSGDTVSVAPDIYYLDSAIIMKNGVSLIGDNAGGCILVGAADKAVIECQNISTTTTTIAWFTITHALTAPYTTPATYGRGIHCYNSSPTIRNNIITGNKDKLGGGGISCESSSSANITNNLIQANKAYSFQDYWYQGGGGILCYDSSPTITNNTITGNSANYAYGGFNDVGGGGILCHGSTSPGPKIISNTITDNSTGSRGGGISCHNIYPYYTSPTIINNVIARNTAGLYGGGVSCEQSSPNITNNTITKNTASTSYSGGGIFCWNSSSSITNNIVANNSAPNDYKAGGIFSGNSSLTINYNDVYGNITFNYTDYPAGTHNIGGIANISSDPLFVSLNPIDLKTADYHIQPGSPCIDKGYNGAPGLGEITLDLDGKPRIVNRIVVMGVEMGVDMGAYEYPITITASAGPGGKISPSGVVNVNYGEDCIFTIAADKGYSIDDVKVDGKSQGAISSYTFYYDDARHTINATFVKIYTITATAGNGGSIFPEGAVIVKDGTNQEFLITLDPGYHVANVLVDGVSVGAPTSYTFTSVTANHTISATFAINTYKLTIAAVNGTVTKNPNQLMYDYGSTVELTAAPATGYHFVNWSGDASGTANPINVTMDADKNITANFAINTYTITASAGSNGSISPSGAVSVKHGTDQAFTITPDTGYHVADVLVGGVSVGTPTSYQFTNVTANHTISATFAIDTYTITASAGLNGSISPSGMVTMNYGANQTFTITPDPNYHVADVLVGGVSVGTPTSYQFTDVTANHTISATFAIDTYTITASAGLNGSITPSGAVIVNYGTDKAFTITPDTGYHVADVLVGGVSVGTPTSYTFTDVTENHTISATFAIDTYTITASAGLNGSISPSGMVTMNYGANQTFTITPDPNYHVAEVKVDRIIQGPPVPTSYIFANVTENHTIEVAFAIDSYTITPTVGANGNISPNVAVTVDHGAGQTFTITPGTGYHILDVLVDGSSVGAVSTYTFTGVTAGHTIEATFAINTYTITPTAGVNGSISPSSAVSVAHGADQIFTIKPDTGYNIVDVKVDGVSQGAVSAYTFTGVTAGHIIEATFAINIYTITPTAGTDGSISPSSTVSVAQGADQTFMIKPDTGYHVANVLVDGVTVGAVSTYTFTNVVTDHTISAVFEIDTYTITASAGAGGSIAPSGEVIVNHGVDAAFSITPNTGYYIADVKVDGTSIGAVTSYTFSSVTAGHAIEASFAIITYTIKANAGVSGSITPSGSVTMNYGGSQSFAIVPIEGCQIDDVKVDGVSQGAINSYEFTNVVADHSIEASFVIITYTITANAGTGGNISPSGSVLVNYDGSVTFTIKPDTGYHVADVLVDGGSAGALTLYTFTNVTEKHTIDATFAIDTYTLTPTVGANGSISPNVAVTVDHGAGQTFTLTPDLNYHVAEVKVDGIIQGPSVPTSYIFTNVTENHTIEVAFAIDSYTITASAGSNGSIAPLGAVIVNYGAKQAFTITPDPNYHVADVLVDGTSAGALKSYTFTDVTANHTISATFAIDTYTITASAGSNGSITPLGAVIVNYGTDQAFTITPDTGYHVVDVLVDVVSVGTPTSHEFTNVTADHTISATFAINTYTLAVTAVNGTVTKDPYQESYNNGATVELTATPATGYHFLNWNGDSSATARTLAVTMDGDKNITANFAVNTYKLTIIAVNGTVTENTNKATHDYNTTVELTATPEAGYHFVDWSGDLSGTTNPATITMDRDKAVTANFAVNIYTITAKAGANGSISPSGAVSVAYGADQTFAIMPAPGYRIADVLADGSSVGAVTSYTFTDVIADHTIEASFAVITSLTIEASAGDGGTISPSGSVSVNHGDSITFKISPTEGYHITDVIVDGKSVGAVTSYTFTNVIADHTIEASFAIKSCEIIASAEEGGIITPAGRVHVKHGGSQTFVFVPNDGYHVFKVRIDGKSVGALHSYTFTNVKNHHKIKVRFAPDAVRADVVIHPDTLNLKSESDEDPITAYINLPRRYHEANIDVATVKLDVMTTQVPALITHTSKDGHYYNRAPGRIVEFSLKAVISALDGQTGYIIMTVSGQLKDGTRFSGSDRVKVIDQGKKNRGHN